MSSPDGVCSNPTIPCGSLTFHPLSHPPSSAEELQEFLLISLLLKCTESEHEQKPKENKMHSSTEFLTWNKILTGCGVIKTFKKHAYISQGNVYNG